MREPAIQTLVTEFARKLTAIVEANARDRILRELGASKAGPRKFAREEKSQILADAERARAAGASVATVFDRWGIKRQYGASYLNQFRIQLSGRRRGEAKSRRRSR